MLFAAVSAPRLGVSDVLLISMCGNCIDRHSCLVPSSFSSHAMLPSLGPASSSTHATFPSLVGTYRPLLAAHFTNFLNLWIIHLILLLSLGKFTHERNMKPYTTTLHKRNSLQKTQMDSVERKPIYAQCRDGNY